MLWWGVIDFHVFFIYLLVITFKVFKHIDDIFLSQRVVLHEFEAFAEYVHRFLEMLSNQRHLKRSNLIDDSAIREHCLATHHHTINIGHKGSHS